jgi:RNA polymerase sigma factor for flagellar operon FliA
MQLLVTKEKLSRSKQRTVNEARRDKLIIDCLSLVKHISRKILNSFTSHVDQEDLIQSGILGLIDAAEKFDEKKCTKFEAYAYHRIRGSIMDYLRLQDWVPRSVRKKDNLIKEAYNILEQKLSRSPQPEEIAEELGISCNKPNKMLATSRLRSILNYGDYNFGENTNHETNPTLTFKDDQAYEPLYVLELEEEQKELDRAIAELQPRERLIISLYYYEGMISKEIAEVMKLSQGRVSQLHHRALRLIKANVYSSRTVKN